MTTAKNSKTASISVILCILVVSILFLSSLIHPQGAYAEQKKISGTGKAVTTISQTKMLPGDLPKHEITLSSRIDMQESSNPEFNGQVIIRGMTDYTAGTGHHWGYREMTHSSGDKLFSAYDGMTKTVLKPNSFPDISFEGKWWYTGGTGRFKGITGEGTYTGKVTKAGLKYDWEGEYDIKQ